jgi:zinc transport system ATP-binding protein
MDITGRTAKAPCGSCCTKLVRVGVKLGNHTILEDINLHLHCGQLTAIVGPNGAGKTTLLRAILGEAPHTGHVHFLDSGKKRPDKPLIGYVPQRLEFDPSAPMTVADLFGAALQKRPAWMGLARAQRSEVEGALETAGAGHLMDRKLGQLSGGEQQRVLLALALTPLPDLLLLDEPVSGVDMAGVDAFYDMVSHLRERYHLSIILVSHDLAAVAGFADRMIFLNKTIIAQGPPAQVLGHPLVQQIFGRLKLDQKPGFPDIPSPAAPRGCVACELEAKP